MEGQVGPATKPRKWTGFMVALVFAVGLILILIGASGGISLQEIAIVLAGVAVLLVVVRLIFKAFGRARIGRGVMSEVAPPKRRSLLAGILVGLLSAMALTGGAIFLLTHVAKPAYDKATIEIYNLSLKETFYGLLDYGYEAKATVRNRGLLPQRVRLKATVKDGTELYEVSQLVELLDGVAKEVVFEFRDPTMAVESKNVSLNVDIASSEPVLKR